MILPGPDNSLMILPDTNDSYPCPCVCHLDEGLSFMQLIGLIVLCAIGILLSIYVFITLLLWIMNESGCPSSQMGAPASLVDILRCHWQYLTRLRLY